MAARALSLRSYFLSTTSPAAIAYMRGARWLTDRVIEAGRRVIGAGRSNAGKSRI